MPALEYNANPAMQNTTTHQGIYSPMGMGIGGFGSVGGFGGGYGMPFGGYGGMGGYGGGFGGFGMPQMGYGGFGGGMGGFGGFGSPYVGNQGSPFGGFGSPFGSPMYGGFGGGMGGYGGQFGGLGSFFGGMGGYGGFNPYNDMPQIQPQPYDPYGLRNPQPNPVTGVMPSEPLPDPNAGSGLSEQMRDFISRFSGKPIPQEYLRGDAASQVIVPAEKDGVKGYYPNPLSDRFVPYSEVQNEGGAYIPDETGQYDPNRGNSEAPVQIPTPQPVSSPSPFMGPRRSPLFQGLASLGQFGRRSPYGMYQQ